MNTHEQIQQYIEAQPIQKRSDIGTLHKYIVQVLPKSELWFLDGKDDNGKIISNPNIGYGRQTIKYADGSTKEFYQIGISTNTTGISVYIIGILDKNFLPEKYSQTIGKAKITGYCIKFKALKDINIDILLLAIKDCVKITSKN